MQLGDRADEDGLLWKDDSVVGVDRIDELGADGLASAHREMLIDHDGKRSARGEGRLRRLRLSDQGRKQERQKKGAPGWSSNHL